MTTTFIYALKDPRNNEIRYIGKANNPYERYNNHINKCRDKNTHKRNWINNLRIENLKPILEILEEVPIEEWKEFEKMYIKKYLNDGCDLMNYTEGGDGCTFGNKTSFKKGEGGKKIVMLDKKGNYIKTFDMISDAAILLNINNSSLYFVLTKKRKSCKGYIFFYENDYEKMNTQDINNHLDWVLNHKKFSNRSSFKNGSKPLHKIRKIYQYSINGILLREWTSASDAGRELSINIGGIGNCARKKAKSAGGFFWSYEKK